MILNISVCIIAISVIFLAFASAGKPSYRDLKNVECKINPLLSSENRNSDKCRELDYKIHQLNEELHKLYTHKVIYKEETVYGTTGFEEKYFFDEKSAKEFMENSHIYEEVLIKLDEEK